MSSAEESPTPTYGVLSWAIPLCFTVMGYGLAAGIWKQTDLGPAQFCVLFVAMKTLTNWIGWGLSGAPRIFAAQGFLRWATIGQLLNGLAWIGYFRALSEGPVAIVQTITAAYTALAVILALVFLKERVVPIQLVGISMVITAGLILGATGDSAAAHNSPWVRDALCTLLCWAGAVTVFKHAYNQPGANDGVFFLTNWLAMGLTVLPYGYFNLGPKDAFSGLALGWLIVALYCIGDLTLFAAIHRGPASIVSPLSGLYPLPTVAYSCLVLKDKITGIQWLAIIMVMAAIVLIAPEKENPVLIMLGRKPKEDNP